MNKLSLGVRTVLAVGLLAAAAIAHADPSYTATAVSGTIAGASYSSINSKTGQLAYSYTDTTSYGYGGSYTQYVGITGANGSGTTTLGGIGSANYNCCGPSAPGPFGVDGQYGSVGIVGANASGTIVANLSSAPGSGIYGAVAATRTASGTITYLGDGTAGTYAGAINNAGAVTGSVDIYSHPYPAYPTYTQYQNTLAAYWAPGAPSPTVINVTGVDAVTGSSNGKAINSSGQVAGNAQTDGSANNQAFVTAANGGTGTLLGTANGIASYAIAINDAGQVGGDIQLSDGSFEAFITNASNNLMVGIGTPVSGDSTALLFLNDNGDAIIKDTTANTDYLYANGQLISLASILPTGTTVDQVVGLTDSNGILFMGTLGGGPDPLLLADPTGAALPMGTANSSTLIFGDVLAGGGTDSTGGTPSGGGSSVPEPALAGLLGLGMAGLVFSRRRKNVG